jgi:hypothetical protein
MDHFPHLIRTAFFSLYYKWTALRRCNGLTVLLIGQERCAICEIQIELGQRRHDAVGVSCVDDDG